MCPSISVLQAFRRCNGGQFWSGAAGGSAPALIRHRSVLLRFLTSNAQARCGFMRGKQENETRERTLLSAVAACI